MWLIVNQIYSIHHNIGFSCTFLSLKIKMLILILIFDKNSNYIEIRIPPKVEYIQALQHLELRRHCEKTCRFNATRK